MTEIRFTEKFRKQYNKVGAKIQRSVDERLRLFMSNSDNPLLRNHPLIGKLKGRYSINVNGDWRAIYSVDSQGVAIFELLGKHSQLYG